MAATSGLLLIAGLTRSVKGASLGGSRALSTVGAVPSRRRCTCIRGRGVEVSLFTERYRAKQQQLIRRQNVVSFGSADLPRRQ